MFLLERLDRVLGAAGVVAMLGGAACGDDTKAGTGGSGGGGTGAATDAGPASASSGDGDTASTDASSSSGAPSSSETSTGPGSGGGGGSGSVDAPVEIVTYEPSTETFPNPERGFYTYTDLLDRDFDTALERGHTLVYSYVHLDDYRDDDQLPPALLDDLAGAFQALRDAGLKVVLRFAYNEGPYPDAEPDAPLDRVLGHIDQLAPTLQDNVDVIAILQGGFVGAWGEWHTSTNDLTEPAARQAIVEALLAALPAERTVAMRYPPYKQALYGEALTDAEAFTGSEEARLGHHNDCFLSSESDVGTYPDDDIEGWKQYVADDTRFVPNGGETCDPFPPRSECASALDEMARLHFSYVNQDYHPDIVQSWVDGGCKDEMDRRLGYRLVLEQASLPPAVRPGGSFRLNLRIRNDGFAGPINPRPIELVLRAGDATWTASVPIDVRTLLPGPNEIALHVLLPSDLPVGGATLSLALDDPHFAGDPRYAIRFANEGVWDEASARNDLGTLDLAADAEGTGVAGRDDLAVELE